MFETIGVPELLIIGVLVILLFGAGKVGKVGKELGTSVKEFRRAIRDDEDTPPPPAQAPQQVYAPAAPTYAEQQPALQAQAAPLRAAEPVGGPHVF